MSRAIWDDMQQQLYEQTGASDTPGSFKYYTPFNDWHTTFADLERGGQQSKELGHRDTFINRDAVNAPRHNTAEQKL